MATFHLETRDDGLEWVKYGPTGNWLGFIYQSAFFVTDRAVYPETGEEMPAVDIPEENAEAFLSFIRGHGAQGVASPYFQDAKPSWQSYYFMASMFKPVSVDHTGKFKPGDRVRLNRFDKFGSVPVGALGCVMEVSPAETEMSEKGCPYYVQFDLTKFKVKHPAIVQQSLDKAGVSSVPDYVISVAQNFGAGDLEYVEGGTVMKWLLYIESHWKAFTRRQNT